MTLDELRAALPAARTHHFLNYAATAPLLMPSAELMAQVAKQGTEPMGLHFTAWLGVVESTRRAIADLISAQPEEVALTTNTSMALSLVAAAVRWRPGDRILYPADEFPSNRYVWQNLAELGVSAQELPPEAGVEFAEQLAHSDLNGVRLVSLSAVSYQDGRRLDVAAVVKLCHARGILVVVDGIQAVGAVPVNVRQWECDFLACGGQKWLLGPVGSGFLYIASGLLAQLRVPLVGWASSRDAGDFEARRVEFCDGARRFEPGLPDVAAIAGLGKSLELLATTGWSAVSARVAQHNARLHAELARLGLRLLHDGPPETQAGIVAIELPNDEEVEQIARTCEQRRIILTIRRRLLRIAAHATTTDPDLDAVLEALAQMHRHKGARAQTPATRSVSKIMGISHDGVVSSGLRWRRALVTGANRGLGEGIAVALARHGCDLTLVGRDLQALTAVAERLKRDYGVAVEPVAVDLSDRNGVTRWLAERQADLARYDVLVNNAALADAGVFLKTDIDQLRAAFETNFFAPIWLTRVLLPGMMERGRGGILNIVTSGARCALPLFSGYASSKAALWTWSEALTRELAGTGVTVTTFLPPHMSTVTQRNLGRQALAYYKMMEAPSRLASPLKVGEQAVAALAAGRSVVVPFAIRIKLAANAMAPGWVGRRLRRVWRGLQNQQED